jgi:hypothetical protein
VKESYKAGSCPILVVHLNTLIVNMLAIAIKSGSESGAARDPLVARRAVWNPTICRSNQNGGWERFWMPRVR